MYLMLNGDLFFFCFRANQTPSTTRPIARKPTNPIAMTTPPFMPPPFLDIVIAVIFRASVVNLAVGFSGAIVGKIEPVGASDWDALFREAGGEGRIRDAVMGEGDAIESGEEFNKGGAWKEAGDGGGGNAREGGLVSGDFIVRGGGKTEVYVDGTAIDRGGEGERPEGGGVMPKKGKGDGCGEGGVTSLQMQEGQHGVAVVAQTEGEGWTKKVMKGSGRC